ncbi:MAG: hypothetical protein CR982_01860 [Candidatus Cloacimonadota bacterium]|nr:MAG: hypothetical protein CR982_01860 [Candidatus Cloacimonadota bacterium]
MKKIGFILLIGFVFVTFSCSGFLSSLDKKSVPKLEEMASLGDGFTSFSIGEGEVNREIKMLGWANFLPLTETFKQYGGAATELLNRGGSVGIDVDVAVLKEKLSFKKSEGVEENTTFDCNKFVLKVNADGNFKNLIKDKKFSFKDIGTKIVLEADIDLSFNNLMFGEPGLDDEGFLLTTDNMYHLGEVEDSAEKRVNNYVAVRKIDTGYIRGKAYLHFDMPKETAKMDEIMNSYKALEAAGGNSAALKAFIETLLNSIEGKIFIDMRGGVIFGATINYETFTYTHYKNGNANTITDRVSKGVISRNEIELKHGKLPVPVDLAKKLSENKDAIYAVVDAKSENAKMDAFFDIIGKALYKEKDRDDIISWQMNIYDGDKEEIYNKKYSNRGFLEFLDGGM